MNIGLTFALLKPFTLFRKCSFIFFQLKLLLDFMCFYGWQVFLWLWSLWWKFNAILLWKNYGKIKKNHTIERYQWYLHERYQLCIHKNFLKSTFKKEVYLQILYKMSFISFYISFIILYNMFIYKIWKERFQSFSFSHFMKESFLIVKWGKLKNWFLTLRPTHFYYPLLFILLFLFTVILPHWP